MKSRLSNLFNHGCLKKPLGIFFVLPCATLLSAASHALTAEEAYAKYYEDWYQVEVIIFERIEQRSEDPETWPVNLSLSYPAQLAFLHSDEPVTENAEDNTAATDENLNNGDTNEADSELLATLQRSGIEDPLNKKYRDAIEKAERDRLTPDEVPYVLLDDTSRALNHEARLLGRDRSMRVLFHEAWRQPMVNADQAPAIVLSGGEAFDPHYELEGTIKLFVSRYLHVHTDIWLSQFEANVGQTVDHWPPLPQRPTPPAVIDENTEALPQEGFDQSDLSNNEPTANDLNFNLRLNTDDSLNTLQYDNKGYNNGDSGLLGANNAPTNTNQFWTDYANINEQPFITKQIVKLEQQRRMRSSELHYLDHPKLGIVILIEKYAPEPPLPKQEAE